MASTTTPLATEATIRKLAERYPFDDYELEILVRCHDRMIEEREKDFLVNLALALPYAHYFLPDMDELRRRVTWIEDYILPAGFPSSIRSAISIDAFVDYANQGELKSLERFIEGVADTGRRGLREATRALLRLAPGMQTPFDVIDCALRLAVADQVLTTPNLDKQLMLQKLESLQPLARSLAEFAVSQVGHDSQDDAPEEGENMALMHWIEQNVPLLTAPLSTFVHHLLFHHHPFPPSRTAQFQEDYMPKLDHLTDVLTTNSLMVLQFMAPEFSGKWHRLYSSGSDGRSFNRLEWSLLGYTGPTVLVVQTTRGATLGAYTATSWKQSSTFYGGPDCFLMELQPHLRIHRPLLAQMAENHFMYLHSSQHHIRPLDDPEVHHDKPFGLGFGGTLAKPRFFIPESLDHCSADFLDKTFEPGELLPAQDMEQFEIQHLEVWAVGGAEVIQAALKDRAEHRESTQVALERARKVPNRMTFAEDLQSGLIAESKMFAHRNDVRGRHEFRVDEEHPGGYRLDNK